MIKKPEVTHITLHKKSRILEVAFDTGEIFHLPCALLRAKSLSADMRHKDVDVEVFKAVNILSIEPVGNYAIKPIFSDGHRTGIFSWETLYEIGKKHG